jgi:hypothetical protein
LQSARISKWHFKALLSHPDNGHDDNSMGSKPSTNSVTKPLSLVKRMEMSAFPYWRLGVMTLQNQSENHYDLYAAK